MRWINRRNGIWELCRTRWLWIHGTTPVNADIWTLSVSLGHRVTRPAIWLNTGKHAGFTLWLDGERSVSLNRVPRSCTCYQCATGAWRDSGHLGGRLAVNLRRQKLGN